MGKNKLDSLVDYLDKKYHVVGLLLVAHGTGDELAKAKDILKSTGHEVSIHSPSER